MLANRPALQPVPQPSGSVASLHPLVARGLQGSGHADYAGDVVSTSAALPFLRAAVA